MTPTIICCICALFGEFGRKREKSRIRNKNDLQANLEELWAIEAKAKTK
mgnify:CR=1 FL=1